MNNKYETLGLYEHRLFFIASFVFWYLCAVASIAIRLFEKINHHEIGYSAIPGILNLTILAYIIYALKSSRVSIVTTEKGLIYCGSKRHLLLFRAEKCEIPWHSVNHLSLSKGGVVSLFSSSEKYTYWNMHLPEDNKRLYGEIESHLQKRERNGGKEKGTVVHAQ